MSLSYVPHFTMQTGKHINNIRRKVGWKFLLVSKLRTNSAGICKDESEEDVRIAYLE